MKLDIIRQLRDHFALMKLLTIVAAWIYFHYVAASSKAAGLGLVRSETLAHLLGPLSVVCLLIGIAFWIVAVFREDISVRAAGFSFAVDVLYITYLCLAFPHFHLLMLGAFVGVMLYYGLAQRRAGRLAIFVIAVVLYGLASTGWPFFHDVVADFTFTSQVIGSLWLLVGAGFVGWKLIEQQAMVLDTLDRITVELLDATLSTEIANDTLKRRHKEIHTLLQINEIISSSLEWEALFTNIILALKNSFIFKNFSLFLYDEEAHVLKLRIANGIFYGEEVGYKLEPGKGIAGWVFQNRTPVCVGDVSRDHRFVEFASTKTIPASLLCVPLVYRGTAIGVISLDSATTDNFTRKDQEFLESIAYLISIAITNSKHYRIVKEESVTDNLTGLTNYRALQNKFREILDGASPTATKLSFMMIDIDYFKKINDKYGHLAGNRVLKSLSELFRNYFRKTDIVARYGGEEFSIILLGTPMSAARDMAESLRHRVSREEFYVDEDEKEAINLTISIGLSGFEDENIIELASRVEVYAQSDQTQLQIQLIKNADEALYYAKSLGRNVVVTWQQGASMGSAQNSPGRTAHPV